MPELGIDSDKVCYLIIKLHEFQALVAPEGDYESSDAVDDGFVAVLEDMEDNPIREELEAFLDGLNDDERNYLFALMLLGRDSSSMEDWEALQAEAADLREEKRAPALLAITMLPGYLEDGLAQFGLSCEDFEMGHL